MGHAMRAWQSRMSEACTPGSLQHHRILRIIRPMDFPAPDAPQASTPGRRPQAALRRWFDTGATAAPVDDDPRADRVDLLRVLPFAAMHLACLALPLVGVSWFAVWVALALYALRMFAITGFYHRYFSHRTFRTSRPMQFAFAVLGAASVQRGPLWWAAHHRHHHRHADTPLDVHSPRRGFWRSHMGWFLTPRHFGTDHAAIPDLVRFPELRLLDRFDIAVPVALAVGLYALGAWLQAHAPGLGTSGPQLLVWGFFVSTVVLFHVTVTINSLAHRWGRRRYATPDDSRNNWLLALLTFGEGWHNNHHHFPGSVRQGVAWYEVDLTWYGLKALSWLGLVWDMKSMPATMRHVRLASP
jgi:stearoyl-CoA desaturase (delta-9 desaturase)